MPAHAYSVVIVAAGAVPHDRLSKELENAPDWIRLGQSNYFVISKRRMEDLKNAFRANLLPTDYVLVTKVDLNEVQGWVPNNFIEWLSRARAKLIELNAVPVLPSLNAPNAPPQKTLGK